MARLEFRGAAAKCTAHADIGSADMSIGIDGDVSGWPTGAAGRNFIVVLERGTARMEKILCSALTGTTLTVVTRGYDGTTAKTHGSGTPVEHGWGASVLDDYGRHVYDVTHNDHTQYIRKTGVDPFTGTAGLTANVVSVGTANAAGSANTLARSDHVHDIADGAIDAAAKLADGTIDENKLAASVAGAALTGGAGTPLAVGVDGSTIEVASDALRVKAAGITLPKFAAGLRPEFIVADATALLALTPAAGDIAYQADIAAYLFYNGTDWRYLANGPAARVFNSANIAIADSTDVTLTFDSERYDRLGMHSTGSRLTVPARGKGIYKIGGHVNFSGHADGERRILSISVNGTTKVAIQERPNVSISYLSISTEYALDTGDYVELIAAQESGSSRNAIAAGDFSPEFWASFDSALA